MNCISTSAEARLAAEAGSAQSARGHGRTTRTALHCTAQPASQLGHRHSTQMRSPPYASHPDSQSAHLALLELDLRPLGQQLAGAQPAASNTGRQVAGAGAQVAVPGFVAGSNCHPWLQLAAAVDATNLGTAGVLSYCREGGFSCLRLAGVCPALEGVAALPLPGTLPLGAMPQECVVWLSSRAAPGSQSDLRVTCRSGCRDLTSHAVPKGKSWHT